jgi:ATP-dependent Clp protease ATP-binding subunit ClpC
VLQKMGLDLERVGATTLNEYRKYIEKDAALERRFQTVMVEAPTVEEAVQILKGLRPKYEAHHTTKPSLPTRGWKQLLGFPIAT